MKKVNERVKGEELGLPLPPTLGLDLGLGLDVGPSPRSGGGLAGYFPTGRPSKPLGSDLAPSQTLETGQAIRRGFARSARSFPTVP